MDPDRAIPFFQPSDPRLKTAYSYGDPRGGSYPDPSELFAENIEPDGIEHSEYIDDADEIDSDDGNDSDSILITELAESTIPIDEGLRDSSFDEDDRDDRGEYDDVEFEEFPSSESDQGVYTTQRGRGTGRGRGRGSGRVRGSTHGRGVGRPRGTSRGALGSVQRRGRRTRPSIKNRTRRDTLDDDEPRRRPRKRKRKGPELSPEFKRLNGLVTQAWMVEDYDTALEHALEAVKLNPEVFPLHATIAEILDKKGRHQDAIGALFAGVHSSRDPKNWWYVVDRLNTLGEDDTEKRQKLGYCYSKLVLLDPNDYQAKLGRAKIYFQNGHHKRAKNDCETLLSKDPIDGVVIELYAKACMELDEPETALSRFEDFIKYCTATEPSDQTHLSWSLITSYVDILMQVEEYEKALIVSRRLTRWMLGRGVEKFWDDYDDDREWDPYPEPRRELVRNFRLGVFDEDTYGLGMPIEFRVRLGVLRILNSDSTNQCFEEGLVSRVHLTYRLD
jgi:general transcription factor 3C polypeptide 3 (transcription factor C subunit 4)